MLDGDTEFWEGLALFRSEGYNRSPSCTARSIAWGCPAPASSTAPAAASPAPAPPSRSPWPRARPGTSRSRSGSATSSAAEIRALGGNFFGGVCINLPRHPAWGRTQETYGDDPLPPGEFGAALTRGAQRWVMACAKHYALNSMENARFTVDVTVDEATLHDVYLPHFQPRRRPGRGGRHGGVQLGQRRVVRAEPVPPDDGVARRRGVGRA